jgi:hypothetical protein
MTAQSGKALAAAAALACWLAIPATATADLIYLGDTTLTGTGVGGQQTLLAFSAGGGPQQGTTAFASVQVNPDGSDMITAGPETQLHGGANIQTRLLADAGITDPSQIWLVWDLNEPGNGQVTLTSLAASFYYFNGGVWSLFHSANLDFTTAPPGNVFLEVSPGTGGAGHVFGLNAEQQAILRLAPGPLRMGLAAGLADETGGFEHFFLTQGPGVPPPPIPEPGAMLLLGLGLIVTARRFSRR